jgi:hypothetical protein
MEPRRALWGPRDMVKGGAIFVPEPMFSVVIVVNQLSEPITYDSLNAFTEGMIMAECKKNSTLAVNGSSGKRAQNRKRTI